MISMKEEKVLYTSMCLLLEEFKRLLLKKQQHKK